MAANAAHVLAEHSIEAEAELSTSTVSFEFLARDLSGFYRQYGKRALDLLIGLPLLLLSVPIVALLALLILVTSGGPAFYVARRMGKQGAEFEMVKLRTMVKDAELVLARWRRDNPELAREYIDNFKLKDDPRIMPLGRFLRATSLDELPQLWNVVRGDMSLVGPRPYLKSELQAVPQAYAAICRIRPGLTGRWQVSGRNAIRPLDRMLMDAEYVGSHGLSSDLGLLISTVKPLLRSDGF